MSGGRTAPPLRLPEEVHSARLLEEATRRCGRRPPLSSGLLAPAKEGPGPAIYTGGSCFGDQILSRLGTAPSHRFSTAQRAQIYSTAQRDGPGPAAYVHAPAVGPTFESTKPSAPVYSIAGREAFGATVNQRTASKEPGPGDYNTHNTLKIRYSEAPKISIGRRHPDPARRFRTPGPGSYPLPSAMGPQPASTWDSLPSWSIGSGKRPALHVHGADNPNGPGQYRRAEAVGRQVLSQYPSSPTAPFGSSKRPAPHAGAARHGPGPGHYDLPGACGAQVSSSYSTMPAPTLKSRTRFGSPYGV